MNNMKEQLGCIEDQHEGHLVYDVMTHNGKHVCKEWRDRRMGKCPSLVQNLHINCLIANLSMHWVGQCVRCKTLQKELSQSISSCKSIGEPQTWQWQWTRGWGELPKIDQGLTGNPFEVVQVLVEPSFVKCAIIVWSSAKWLPLVHPVSQRATHHQ